ncbi:leucine--tRNA ligase [Saliphagus sp. LR7]|uniref:leucine--tRNA ligase n=1 Tax=Saliphagus sp. LR7 TaxID=2282654 RepID=UPI000DF7FF9C|nr:leucine--tRNA ligase [Saliphagus sp. LR7]
MTRQYNPAEAREFWQYVWDREDVYALPEDVTDPTYVLGMIPYTSGTLHMGHVRNYAIADACARYRRMQGEDVLHPMGWDAFGLPAENAAERRHTDPESWTRACISRMREELRTLGFGYDWSREITTCEPEYYRWNQWLFERFFEEGLVSYEGATANWCPDCETVLADAQVESVSESGSVENRDSDQDQRHGTCWRCGTAVERRELDQWFLRVTEYADDLLSGLDDLPGWPEGVREIQRNWIGRREGARIAFRVPDYGTVEAFSAEPETVYGATFLALSPGHDLAAELATDDPGLTDFLERDRDAREGGYRTDARAIHPLTGEELPVYVADYVLADVGTGAVMGVPAHNDRDRSFAREQGLPLEEVIVGEGAGGEESREVLTGSGEYDGLARPEAREALFEREAFEPATTYRLRDWLISRQRYWGTPIPVVHCKSCGPVLVPEEELPVELPEFVETTGNPLEAVESFVEAECPDCGADARRETDTMDTFVDSSWYFLRFLDPDLPDAPFDPDAAREWMPVDLYVGGDEHATAHLLYARFVMRALADMGLVDDPEPFERLVTQGTVLHGGEKMSTSTGNVVAPHEYGAETTRLFLLSGAHPEQDFEWTADGVGSAYDLQQSLFSTVVEFVEEATVREEREPRDDYLDGETDRTIEIVTAEYERVRFHRSVAEIRRFVRLLGRYHGDGPVHEESYRRALLAVTRLIGPLAPYVAEECWNKLRGEGLVAGSDWPEPAVERGADRVRRERRLVDRTTDDVREIAAVVDRPEPDSVEIVVAPDWTHRVADLARETGDPATVAERLAGEGLGIEAERVREYAASVVESGGVDPGLKPERELAVLREAAWLVREEFGAEVTVRRGEGGELADEARPGKPAIRLE